MEKLLLLGHAGKIGKKISKRLENDFKIVIINGIIDNEEVLIKRIKEERPGIIINTIGLFAGDIKNLISANIALPALLASAIEKTKEIINPYTIHFSTGGIYSADNTLKTEETMPNPVNFYNITKYAGEKFITVLKNSNPDFKFAVLRPGSVFGEGVNDGFVYHFNNQARDGKIVIRGRSDKIRSIANVDYIVDLVEKMAKEKPEGIFNVQTETITLQNSVDLLVKKYNCKVENIPDNSNNDLLAHMHLNGDKAHAFLKVEEKYLLKNYLQ